MSEAYTAAERRRFPQTSRVREEARRIDERLEATLRIPDVEPTAIVVIAHALPTIPEGMFVVAAENDQFGTAEELRTAVPHARIATVGGVDHFFVGKRDEVGTLVAEELARVLPVPSHLP